MVIAVMPQQSLFYRLNGAMINPNMAPLSCWWFLEQVDWELSVTFASWSPRSCCALGWGLCRQCLCGLVSWLTLLLIFGVTSDIPLQTDTSPHHFGQSNQGISCFINIIGSSKYIFLWCVFVGIISGFIGATAFNKYYNFRKYQKLCLSGNRRSAR